MSGSPQSSARKTVFLPLDGSDKDERATQAARAFANLVDANIHIVRVITDPPPATHVSAGLAMLAPAPREEAALRGEIETSLQDLAARLSSDTRRTIRWEVVNGEDVATALMLCADSSADVIVMATRAPGTLERAFYGSVADEIVRKSSLPVLIVPPGTGYAPGGRIEMRRALVPLDGSDASLTAVDRLLALVSGQHLECVLIQAVQRERTGGYMTTTPESSSPTQAERAEARLQEVAGRMRRSGNVANVRVVESVDPAAVIVSAIREELVDLIAMSTHGEGGLRRALHGSVANRVVRASEVPVFLVTPGVTNG